MAMETPPPIVHTYILIHVNFLPKCSSNDKSKNLVIKKFSMSLKKTPPNQNVISNKYSVLIGRMFEYDHKTHAQKFYDSEA